MYNDENFEDIRIFRIPLECISESTLQDPRSKRQNFKSEADMIQVKFIKDSNSPQSLLTASIASILFPTQNTSDNRRMSVKTESTTNEKIFKISSTETHLETTTHRSRADPRTNQHASTQREKKAFPRDIDLRDITKTSNTANNVLEIEEVFSEIYSLKSTEESVENKGNCDDDDLYADITETQINMDDDVPNSNTQQSEEWIEDTVNVNLNSVLDEIDVDSSLYDESNSICMTVCRKVDGKLYEDLSLNETVKIAKIESEQEQEEIKADFQIKNKSQIVSNEKDSKIYTSPLLVKHNASQIAEKRVSPISLPILNENENEKLSSFSTSRQEELLETILSLLSNYYAEMRRQDQFGLVLTKSIPWILEDEWCWGEESVRDPRQANKSNEQSIYFNHKHNEKPDLLKVSFTDCNKATQNGAKSVAFSLFDKFSVSKAASLVENLEKTRLLDRMVADIELDLKFKSNLKPSLISTSQTQNRAQSIKSNARRFSDNKQEEDGFKSNQAQRQISQPQKADLSRHGRDLNGKRRDQENRKPLNSIKIESISYSQFKPLMQVTTNPMFNFKPLNSKIISKNRNSTLELIMSIRNKNKLNEIKRIYGADENIHETLFDRNDLVKDYQMLMNYDFCFNNFTPEKRRLRNKRVKEKINLYPCRNVSDNSLCIDFEDGELNSEQSNEENRDTNQNFSHSLNRSKSSLKETCKFRNEKNKSNNRQASKRSNSRSRSVNIKRRSRSRSQNSYRGRKRSRSHSRGRQRDTERDNKWLSQNNSKHLYSNNDNKNYFKRNDNKRKTCYSKHENFKRSRY